MRWQFFLPLPAAMLRSANVRQREHALRRHRKDQALKNVVATYLAQGAPKEAFVNAEHPTRYARFLLVRTRLMDDDAVGNALKPVIDVLKCGTLKHGDQGIVYRDGLFYDDSPRFVRMSFGQATVKEIGLGARPGVFITLAEKKTEATWT